MRPLILARNQPPAHRYYVNPQRNIDWPPEVRDYNASFTRLLEKIKRRHDPTVTTVAQGVNEWKVRTSVPESRAVA